jgi:Fe2+ or Zn2+ uptake regulation protein
LVCIGCGNIVDADDSSEIIIRLRDQVSNETRFQVMWQRVDFHGWCPSCQPVDEPATAAAGQ